jgi:hypothetical protein
MNMGGEGLDETVLVLGQTARKHIKAVKDSAENIINTQTFHLPHVMKTDFSTLFITFLYVIRYPAAWIT